MATFDPQSAYLSDWAYFDDVVDAKYYVAEGPTIDTAERPTNQTVKVRPLTIASSEYRAFASVVSLRADDRVFVIWAGTGTLSDLQADDRIVISGVTWLVSNSRETNRGYWVIAARKGVTNA